MAGMQHHAQQHKQAGKHESACPRQRIPWGRCNDKVQLQGGRHQITGRRQPQETQACSAPAHITIQPTQYETTAEDEATTEDEATAEDEATVED